MLNSQQFSESTSFLRSYGDALKCVEQITERRQALSHYAHTSSSIIAGLQAGTVKLAGGEVVSQEGDSNFSFVRAHAFAKEVFSQHAFNQVKDRVDFEAKLDAAIGTMKEEAQ